jgi:hypothetical protein
MSNNKIFILLPDGIGLRNFAYSNFRKIGISNGFEVVYWNGTPFTLSEMGFNEIKIEDARPHLFTTICKNARQQIELNLSIKKTKDITYNSYRFPLSNKGLKNVLKNLILKTVIRFNSSEKGLIRIRKQILEKERGTVYYQQCLLTLKKEKPKLVFCTNQRHTSSIAPILAAQELGILTATFIFSWDNLPKATMVLETDYYFVWSEYMKKELQFYYPYIKSEQVFITGTPQFEAHYDEEKKMSKDVFFEMNGLDVNKKYICYSGDDVTTCPDDQQYLGDVAAAVKELNKKGYNLGIIFRRCPVDFSKRYDTVLEKYSEIIVPLAPLWENKGDNWGVTLPTIRDMELQVNTIAHSEMVINLGSSMVFDFATNNKACGFINYDVRHKVKKDWFVEKIYKFVHFRSMPNKESVFWLNSAAEIEVKIEEFLGGKSNEVVLNAQKWFEIINQHHANEASERMWEAIAEICNKELC